MTGIKLLIPPLIFALSLGGCSKNNQNSNVSKDGLIHITYWRPEIENDPFPSVLKDYLREEGSESLAITYKTFKPEEYEQKLVEALAKGQGPDIFSIRNDQLTEYRGKLYPLPDAIANSERLKQRFVTQIGDELFYNNKLYGIPVLLEPLKIIVNKSLVPSTLISGDMPLSWDGIERIAKATTKYDKDGKVIQSGLAIGTGSEVENSADIISLMMLQAETQMTTPDHRQAAFHLFKKTDSEIYYPGKEALRYYTSFANPKSSRYTYDPSLGNTVEAFAKGKVVMMFTYPSIVNFLSQLVTDVESMKLVPVPNLWDIEYPTNDQAGTISDPVDYMRYSAEVVNVNSKQRYGAWVVLSDLIGRIGGEEAISPFVKDSGKFKDRNPAIFAKSWYKGAFPKETDQIMRDMLDDISKRGKSVDESINRQVKQ